MMEEQAVQPAATGGKRIKRTGLGTGTTSLLMIFTLLCFSTLALLSLATATSDARIKGRGLLVTQSMAAAEGEADRVLAELDAALLPFQQEYIGGQSTYFAEAAALAEGFGCTPVEDKPGLVAFTVPVNENNVLVTTLRLLPPGSGARYQLESQLQFSTAEWSPQSGELWSGNG